MEGYVVSSFVTQPWNALCMLPPDVVNLSATMIDSEQSTRVKRDGSRRGTTCKMGEATRRAWRVKLTRKYGWVCHLCIALGKSGQEAAIDQDLPWPHRMCFTRDHVTPRSMGGRDTVANQRPAHNACNMSRGNKTVEQWVAYMNQVGELQ